VSFARSITHRVYISPPSRLEFVRFRNSSSIIVQFPPVSRNWLFLLALSLLVSRVRLADDVQVSVMSLAGLPSNDLKECEPLIESQRRPAATKLSVLSWIVPSHLAVLASLLDRTLDLHTPSLLHQTVSERSRDGCCPGASEERPGTASRKSPQGIAWGQ
jgi:hypothetical protein